MPDFAVRKIRESDALGLSLLFQEWGISRAKKEIKETLRLPSQSRLVAEKDANLVGHILVKLGSSHHSHIATLYSLVVEPGQRGKGIAGALVREALESLPERTETALLQVQSDNEPAKKLFAKFGFRQYGYLQNAFKKESKYKDNILMCKSLRERPAEKN